VGVLETERRISGRRLGGLTSSTSASRCGGDCQLSSAGGEDAHGGRGRSAAPVVVEVGATRSADAVVVRSRCDGATSA
jgi:hypothetical protein